MSMMTYDALEILNNLTLEDLDGENFELAEVIGIESFISLCQHYGGTRIYIKVPTGVVKKVRDKQIIKEYNGYNKKELSQKYNITVERISQIVEETKENMKC